MAAGTGRVLVLSDIPCLRDLSPHKRGSFSISQLGLSCHMATEKCISSGSFPVLLPPDFEFANIFL